MSLLSDVLGQYRRERTFEIAEVSERQRERLLDVMGHQGAQAADLARSASHIAFSTQDIAVEVSRMAAVVDVALPAIVEHLALAAERLGGVKQMLARPEETAAAESYRNGTYALANGWWEEAVTDLTEAVRRYRYNPRAWFNLGIAQHRHDAAGAAAADAFGRCARNGVSVEPALAARAVLLAAVLHRAAGRIDESVGLLRNYADKIDNCAELHLALGVHHHDHDHLVKALVLAPDLAIDARIGKATGLDGAAAVVCQLVDGPVRRLRTIEQLTARVAEHARDAGLENVQPPPEPLYLVPDGVDALLQVHAALPDAIAVITLLADEVREQHRQRRAVAENATKASDAARADAQRAVQTAQRMESLTQELASNIVRCSKTEKVQLHQTGQARQTQQEVAAQIKEAERQAIERIEKAQWLIGEQMRATNRLPEGEQAAARSKLAQRFATATSPHIVNAAQVHAMETAGRAAQQATKLVAAAKAEAEQLWRQISRLAVGVLHSDVAAKRVQAAKDNYENDQRRDINALQQSLWALLAEPARLLAREAEDRANVMISSAEDAIRLTAEAAAVMAAAQDNVEVALRTAESSHRLIPFDLPGEWNSQPI